MARYLLLNERKFFIMVNKVKEVLCSLMNDLHDREYLCGKINTRAESHQGVIDTIRKAVADRSTNWMQPDGISEDIGQIRGREIDQLAPTQATGLPL